MSRTQRLLRSLPKNARVVEVGPSFNPLAAKQDGWDTFVIDHAPREELIAKYKDQDVSKIEEVDYVWRGGSLADAVPQERHGTFDAFIASHVIEHSTDIISFLHAAQTLIKPSGVIILAVPDKRKCFDFYRHPSATADAIAAFHERRNRHTVRTHIDYALNMAHKPGGEGAWFERDTRTLSLACPITDEPRWREAAQLPYYTDAHAWVFVPSSFSLMIVELSLMGYIDLQVEDLLEAEATEFYVWLRKSNYLPIKSDYSEDRRRLMDLIFIELADQSRQIHGSPLHVLQAINDELRDQLSEAEARAEAMRTVLAAVATSTGRLGLNRRKFKRLIADAGRLIPDSGPRAVQHQVLLEETRKMLHIKIDELSTDKEA